MSNSSAFCSRIFVSVKLFLQKNSDILIALLIAALGIAVFYPGAMSGDSVDQWRQVLFPGDVSNMFPPSMVLLWRALHKIFHGPQGLLYFHYIVYVLSISLFGRSFSDNKIFQTVFVITVGLFPVVFFQVGILWKDISMLTSLSMSIALLFIFEKKRRIYLLILSFIFLIYGVSVRYNAIVCVVPYAVYLYTIFFKTGGVAGNLKMILFAVLLLLCTYFPIKYIDYLAVKPQNRVHHLENYTFISDLCGMSNILGVNVVPEYVFNKAGRKLGLEFCERYYKPYHNAVMWQAKYLTRHKTSEKFPDRQFKKDFLAAIVKYPAAYLRVRLELIQYLMGIKESYVYQPFLFKIQKFKPDHYLYRFSKKHTMRNAYLIQKAEAIATFLYKSTILYEVWFYLTVCLAQLIYFLFMANNQLVRKKSVMILSTGLLYWLPLTLISPSAEFRFSVFTIFCSILIVPVTIMSIAERFTQGKLLHRATSQC